MVEALALLVPLWELQTFLAPEPLHLLVVYLPAFGLQQLADLAPLGVVLRKRLPANG